MAIICLAMEDSQLPLVRSASGAHDAWSKLEDHFEKKSVANKLFLRRHFFTTMMEEGDDVLQHINKLKTLAEQLDAVGTPVSEGDWCVQHCGKHGHWISGVSSAQSRNPDRRRRQQHAHIARDDNDFCSRRKGGDGGDEHASWYRLSERSVV